MPEMWWRVGHTMPEVIANLKRYGEACGSTLTTSRWFFAKPASVDV